MSFHKNKLPGTKDEFVSWLADRIIRGKLSVGEKLPTERDFEQQTGIGKSAVHGALVELEHKGFIKIIPRKGTYVSNYVREGTVETLNEILRSNEGRLSFKMSIELVELRNVIEGGALIRLAKHHTDEDIAKLEQKIENLDREMLANATNSLKLSQLSEEKEAAEQELEEKMDRWVYLNDLAEKIDAQKK